MKLEKIIILSIFCLSGCGAEMKSAVYSGYTDQPHRIFIAGDLGGVYGFAEPVKSLPGEDIVKSMNSCGIEAQYFTADDLISRNSVAEEIHEFSPDSVLTIQWTWKATRFQGAPPEIVDYLLEITDLKTHSIVWKATMKFDSNLKPPRVFANSVIDQMKKDKIIPDSCVDDTNILR